MSYGHTGRGLVGGKSLVDSVGQRDPVFWVNLSATNVDDLLGQDFSERFCFGYPGEHLLDGELASPVAVVGEVGAAFTDKGDGAAGAE